MFPTMYLDRAHERDIALECVCVTKRKRERETERTVSVYYVLYVRCINLHLTGQRWVLVYLD